ncbi:hypothetical protein M407DRAFT_19291 [Tulasnella calospora MUT 4182]|uniref:Uncharacterized protein n=1 Tax=Tulasnella calospora MUT 4182 TaxID=1051891 RepID=A0A0C3LCZ0_9AGAM|nr:hypothetical protein M407DRAFT_19291 [Tulasnella calospora MUT 4182]
MASRPFSAKLQFDTTVISMQVTPYEPRPDDTDPCASFNESDCPFVTNLVLDAEAFCTSFEYGSKTKFMTRVSWPASFPVDPDFIVHEESISGSSKVGLSLRARNRGRRNPYVAPSESTGEPKPVPFIMTVERLLLGSVPGSMLPLIGVLAAGAAAMVWFANVVLMPSLLTLAAKAEEEARLEVESKKQ